MRLFCEKKNKLQAAAAMILRKRGKKERLAVSRMTGNKRVCLSVNGILNNPVASH